MRASCLQKVHDVNNRKQGKITLNIGGILNGAVSESNDFEEQKIANAIICYHQL